MKLRAEWFGGILQFERAAALISVNRALLRALGYPGSTRWNGPSPGHLSAPTEVQLQLSRRCGAGCKGCYVSATPSGPSMTLEQAKRVIDTLAEQGVFQVALGGGEPLELDWLFELGAYARERGLTPTLTTAGLDLTQRQAEACRVFAQVNVSVDGVGEGYRRARGFDGFARAERALRMLRGELREVGLNCVVTRSGFDQLADVARLARRLRLNQLQLLRIKPTGRGGALDDEQLTDEQARQLFPKVRWLALRNLLRIRLDCSFAPMVFWHRPPLWVARFFGVVGCAGETSSQR